MIQWIKTIGDDDIFDSALKIALCWTPLIPHGSRSSLVYATGGFGLRSLSQHSCAAFIASVCSSGFVTEIISIL